MTVNNLMRVITDPSECLTFAIGPLRNIFELAFTWRVGLQSSALGVEEVRASLPSLLRCLQAAGLCVWPFAVATWTSCSRCLLFRGRTFSDPGLFVWTFAPGIQE